MCACTCVSGAQPIRSAQPLIPFHLIRHRWKGLSVEVATSAEPSGIFELEAISFVVTESCLFFFVGTRTSSSRSPLLLLTVASMENCPSRSSGPWALKFVISMGMIAWKTMGDQA